jgi:hypothetical protein
MSKPVGYLATNPTYPLNANKLVWETENWHITWEFKPLYLHPDPRVAELEAVLRECREVIEEAQTYCEGPQWSPSMAYDCGTAIAKIDDVLK